MTILDQKSKLQKEYIRHKTQYIEPATYREVLREIVPVLTQIANQWIQRQTSPGFDVGDFIEHLHETSTNH